MSSEHLWVYGSLRRGCSNRHARLLDRSARYRGPARVQARLYRVSWYPGVRLGGDSEDWVLGDLFRLLDPKTLPMLDEYEGSYEYQRVRTVALPDSGEPVKCWVYEYIGGVSEARRIVSGDWLKENESG